MFRFFVGLVGRGVFWLGLIYIVVHAAKSSWVAGETGMAILKVVLFPLTFLLYPWFSGLWPVFLGALVGYWVSTFLGGLEPVD